MPRPTPADSARRLASISGFDDLLVYLKENLGWPIEADDFDDVTFDYDPAELGIDAANAAKIMQIKQLRPLVSGQPWGVFFVRFEPKHLPVIALRRILGQLAVRKRSSASSSERAAWSVDDLLFVSNYGEGETRQLSFAHFSQGEGGSNLPTLKVLGWDNLDTPLHVERVASILCEKLAWPRDVGDHDTWRTEWSSAFTLRNREVITTSKVLAIRLAGLARSIRERIRCALRVESAHGPVTRLMSAFRESLIHDLDEDTFADMYAQTIAYGLLSARITNPSALVPHDTHLVLPLTSPFLKELMRNFMHAPSDGQESVAGAIDFDELGVSEVVQVLDDANIEAILVDFGDRNPQEDPVIHFYELFLKEYDAKKRMQRGVFYTPRPVVSYIVRSVDAALRTELGLEDGLADVSTWGQMLERTPGLRLPKGVLPGEPFVRILDPATGTGTFLVEVIEVIHCTLVRKWRAQGLEASQIETRWNGYVSDHLLPSLHGYEVLMAPYAIAHMKIGLKLQETGYHFASDQRTRVYLTNALKPAPDGGQQSLSGMLPALAHEAMAVNSVKTDVHFTVVLGNPPYAGHSANHGDWIEGLVEEYFQLDGERLRESNLKWLRDDYVKFVRMGQELLRRSSVGVLGLITNHGYIDNPTFRGMRVSLLRDFTSLRVVDLHGNTKKRERAEDGSADQNVFDIQQGVAVIVASKGSLGATPPQHAHLRGTREAKYAVLSDPTGMLEWEEVLPIPPFYILAPQDGEARAEYGRYIGLVDNAAAASLGVLTKRDSLVVGVDKDAVVGQIGAFVNPDLDDEDVAALFGLPLADKDKWNLSAARKNVRHVQPDKVRPVLYRPFDIRCLYYEDALVARPNRRVLRNLDCVEGNLALILGRQGMATGDDSWDVVFVTDGLSDQNVFRRGGGTVIPLWLAPPEGALALDLVSCNFSALLIKPFERLGADPLALFRYAYAVLHSPTYRARYAGLLRIDFPRLPVPGSTALLEALAQHGERLIDLHLMKGSGGQDSPSRYIGAVQPRVASVSWADDTVWLGPRAPDGTGRFSGVPQSAWEFRIGGYQVCEKWLKDRRGSTLSGEDVAHYQGIVAAVSDTIRLMHAIDDVIEEHGGWPGAFESTASGS